MDILQYFLKSTLILSLFLGVYTLFLKKESFFNANRYFLLIGLLSSALLPVLTVSYPVYLEPLVNNAAEVMVTSETNLSAEHIQPELASVWNISNLLGLALGLYCLFGLVLLVRLLVQIANMNLIIRRSEQVVYKGNKVYVHPDVRSPFVFANAIFIDRKDYLKPGYAGVMAHEIEHLTQRHWMDVFISELFIIFQWFNPLVWMYGRTIKQNLEYLADEGVLKQGFSMSNYLQAIISETMGEEAIVLANHFRDSRNKRRLKMMKKVKSSKWRQLKLLLMLPIIGSVMWAFSEPEYRFVNDSEESGVMKTLDSGSANVSQKVIPIEGVVFVTDTLQIRNSETGMWDMQYKQRPLSGVSVNHVDGNEMVSTNKEGIFEIQASVGAKLEFSSVGYKTTARYVENEKPMKVAMDHLVSVAQNETKMSVKGMVKNEKGEAMPGVSIVVKGGTLGCVSDREGRFSISVPDDCELVFSFVGYKTHISKIVEAQNLGVVMSPAVILLESDEYRAEFKGKILPPPPPPPPATKEREVKKEKLAPPPPPPPKAGDDEEEVFFVVESMPQYKFGGAKGYFASFYSKCAEASKKHNLSGDVEVMFTVDAKGEVVNVQAKDRSDQRMAEIAVKIVSQLNDWEPGKQRGKAVPVNFVVKAEF